jgi:LmbE family N-acetylglucosaminyl deacetylase
VIGLLPSFDPGRPARLLCIGAHSDDIEIGCGGTVLTLVSSRPGIDVRWVVVSAAAERATEARRSAEKMLEGAGRVEVVVGGFRERYLPYLPEVKEFFDDLGGGPSPDLVLAPRVDDLHQDHRTVAELTLNTFRDHLVLHYEIPKYDADLAIPNVYVPLTEDVARRKVEHLMAAFPSQAGRHWYDQETFRGLMRLRGVECRAPDGYAEGLYGRKLRLL